MNCDKTRLVSDDSSDNKREVNGKRQIDDTNTVVNEKIEIFENESLTCVRSNVLVSEMR
jgi:hypothetical protein